MREEVRGKLSKQQRKVDVKNDDNNMDNREVPNKIKCIMNNDNSTGKIIDAEEVNKVS